MDLEYAKYLLNKTRKNYNSIAQEYTRTRAFIPEDIKDLGKYAWAGEKVLDLGCGNGRFVEVLRDKNIDYFGIDISERLIEIAKKNYPEAKFQVADALNLPFASNFFNKVYSISVLHHIPSEKLRLQFLKEAKRTLKPEGLLILRVWNLWRRNLLAQRLLLKYALLRLVGKSKLDFKDVFYPWKNSEGKILVQRYIHCFTKRELIALAKKAGFEIKEVWVWGRDKKWGTDKISNIYLIAKKSS